MKVDGLLPLAAIGQYAGLLWRTYRVFLRSPGQVRAIFVQLHLIGARSLPVVAVAGFFTGMIVAVQFYDTLLRFGAGSLLGTAVGLSITRELGPLLTALIVVGRAGSAICAELAIMRTDQQLDAIECMAIDPHGYLLAPRMLCFIVAVPLLAAIFNVFGICGGALVAATSFGANGAHYLGNLADGVLSHDIATGFVKSIAFGVIVGWLCAAKGFFNDGLHGAEGVSRVTTDAVVLASLSVLCADYLLSALMR